MSKPFTIHDLKRSKAAQLNQHVIDSFPRGNREATNYSPQKEWIEMNLQMWCNQRALHLETELQFSPDRKFRFDWAVSSIRLAVEYEGIFSAKSRHTTVNGFSRDMEKYNLAQLEGWTVLRYGASTYKQLSADLRKVKVK